MHALFLVLNKTEYLEDVLTALVDVGIRGATILDSQGMGGALVNREGEEVPVFGFLKSFIELSHPYNKTIFTIVKDEELIDRAVEAITSVVGDINAPGVGLIFTLPVGRVYGLK